MTEYSKQMAALCSRINGGNLVGKLLFREVRGSAQRHKKDRARKFFQKIPGRLCFKLTSLVPQIVLDEGNNKEHAFIPILNNHSRRIVRYVFLGFTKDGQFVVSYSLQVDADEQTGFPVYVYNLQWWWFIPYRPLQKISEVRLFEEGIVPDVFIAFCEWPEDTTKILVYGHSLPRSKEEGCQCFITITAVPSLDTCAECSGTETSLASEIYTKRKGRCLKHSFCIYSKYELAPPFPAFIPRLQLKADGVVVLNTGDSLVALNVGINQPLNRCWKAPSKPNSSSENLNSSSFIGETEEDMYCQHRPAKKHDISHDMDSSNVGQSEYSFHHPHCILGQADSTVSRSGHCLKTSSWHDVNCNKPDGGGPCPLLSDDSVKSSPCDRHFPCSCFEHKLSDRKCRMRRCSAVGDCKIDCSVFQHSSMLNTLEVCANPGTCPKQNCENDIRDSSSRSLSQQSFFSPSNSNSSTTTSSSENMLLHMNESRSVFFSIRKFTYLEDSGLESIFVVEDDFDLAYRSVLPLEVRGSGYKLMSLTKPNGDVIQQDHITVCQLTFDIEHYLEEVIRSVAEWGHRYIAFLNYDLQLLDVNAENGEVLAKVFALIQARQCLESSKHLKRSNKTPVQSYQTSITFTWSLSTGTYQTFHIEDLVPVDECDLKRKEWNPGKWEVTRLYQCTAVPQPFFRSVYTLSNEAVIKGKSLSLLLAAHHFVAISR